MPYIIAVLALVVVGVGYTLYQPEQSTEELVSNTPTLSELKETIATELAEVTDATSTDIVTLALEEVEEIIAEEPEPDVPAPTPTPTIVTPIPEPAPEPAAPVVTPAPEPVVTTPPPTAPTNDFADGTYSSSVHYRVPSHSYSMDVSVTVKNDIITAVNVAYDSSTARDSYTRRFDKSYASYVIGKDLQGINVSRIGGASLTTKAFNKALDSIEAQAAA